MVATDLKAETMGLMDQRAALELQMNSIIASLTYPGGPGISGNLLDSEGFPRSDIDIPAIRSQRKKLAELCNDHKDITNKIEKNLELLHAVRLNKGLPILAKEPGNSSAAENASSVASQMDIDAITEIPFAVIDEIDDDSPAAKDGLKLGDEIVKFGGVAIGDRSLDRLASVVKANEGHPVPLCIIRQGSAMNLRVTPRKWHGHGLLGCHFQVM